MMDTASEICIRNDVEVGAEKYVAKRPAANRPTHDTHTPNSP